MSDYQQKDGTGALFKNERKERENQPDYQGDCTVGGKKYRIGAWLREAKSGKKYMSLSFDVPQQRQPEVAVAADFDDKIPF